MCAEPWGWDRDRGVAVGIVSPTTMAGVCGDSEDGNPKSRAFLRNAECSCVTAYRRVASWHGILPTYTLLCSGKKLGEVALFDAINGKKELAALEKWLFEQQLPAELKILAAKGSAKEQSDYLTQSGLRFRAYFTGNPAKAKASASAAEYAGRHLQLKQDLDDWFNTNTKTLDPKVAQDFAKNYQVISVDAAGEKRDPDTKHNQIMGDGNLKKALADL